MIIDLFAGPGGWDVAARRLGLDVIGVELDDAAVATRRAAGLPTIHGDVSEALPGFVGEDVEGLIASPPCQTFSQAGQGSGRRQLTLVAEAVRRLGRGEWPTEEIEATNDPRTRLVLEPLRWALALQPTWLAFEQVPPVLPVWEVMAEVLREHGWHVVTGCVQAEQYGVPQTRRRADLLGHRDRPVAQPTPTHSRYHSRSPERIDPGVPRWVSMADALGDTMVGATVRSNYGTGGNPAARGERTGDQPSATVTSKVDRNVVTRLQHGPQANATVRDADQPAATLVSSMDNGGTRWLPEFNDQSGSPFDPEWPEKRPATTVATRGLVQNPGETANRHNGSTKSRNDGVRISVAEAAVLQTFPVDHPWQGSKSKQYEQVGNAVPPLLAEALLCEVVGIPFDPARRGSA